MAYSHPFFFGVPEKPKASRGDFRCDYVRLLGKLFTFLRQCGILSYKTKK